MTDADIAPEVADDLIEQGRKFRSYVSMLQSFDPVLDENWERAIIPILEDIDPARRKYIESRCLLPKGVKLDPKTGEPKFSRATVKRLLPSLVEPVARKLGEDLIKIQLALLETDKLVTFANRAEKGLSLITQVDRQAKVALIVEVERLRRAFLHDLAEITRRSKITMPGNHRKLTIEQVKLFILNVFLRHELAGNSFRSQPLKVLEKHSNEFVRTRVAEEARSRQCEIFIAEGFVFLVSPTVDGSTNSYSLRRFLHEEALMGRSEIYINGLAFNLAKADDPDEQALFEKSIVRILSLERRVADGVRQTVEEMDKVYTEQLSPKLFRPQVAADGSDMDEALRKHLQSWERDLSLLVIGKFIKALTVEAKSQDDLDYLSLNTRTILLAAVYDLMQFNLLPIAEFSAATEELDHRMTAYFHYFEKNHDAIFRLLKKEESEPLHEMALAEQLALVKDSKEKMTELEEELKDVLLREKKKEDRSAFQKKLSGMFGGGQSKVNSESVRKKIDAEKRRCLLTFIKNVKRHSKVFTYMELENLIPVDELKRHYTLAHGVRGVGRLPLYIRLYEDRSQLNVEHLESALKYDVLVF